MSSASSSAIEIEKNNRLELQALHAQQQLRVSKHEWVESPHEAMVGDSLFTGTRYTCTKCLGTNDALGDYNERKLERQLNAVECLGLYVDMRVPGAAQRVLAAQSK
jgi:hypothetical protein